MDLILGLAIFGILDGPGLGTGMGHSRRLASPRRVFNWEIELGLRTSRARPACDVLPEPSVPSG